MLALTPLSSQAARSLMPDNPTETMRKAAAREKAATKAKAKEAKAAKKSKRSVAYRFRKLSTGFNHAVLVLVGLEDSKAVTSPAKLNRQLHIHQKHLKAKARMEAKARRRRTSHMFN
ncbi:hypothetical protein GCM10027594_07000 [Hymenobacter agri]